MTRSRLTVATLALSLVAACGQDSDPAGLANEEFPFAAITIPDVAVRNVIACKEGPAGTFNFSVAATDSVNFPSGNTFTLVDDECKTVGVATATRAVRVTEDTGTLPAGTQFDSVVILKFTSSAGQQSGPPVRQGVVTTDSTTVSPVGGDIGYVLVFYNSLIPVAEGRMTGGGNITTTDGVKVTHGFNLPCDASEDSGNLQINWDSGNRFHLEDLVSAACVDDPAVSPHPPAAPFDTHRGSGTGRFNGEPGATATWIMVDAGEPGTNDLWSLVIVDANGNTVLSFANKKLERGGNHQAHNN